MTARYTPEKGCVAAQLVAYMAKQPAGRLVYSAELADHAGIDSQAVQAHLAVALLHRLVVKTKPPGTRLLAWRLATPAERYTPDDPDDEEVPPTTERPAPPTVLGSIFRLAASEVAMPHTPVRPVRLPPNRRVARVADRTVGIEP